MGVEIFTEIAQSVKANKPAWLATIIHTEGSIPGRVGMKMLLRGDGSSLGTVGGGAIEKRVIDKVMAERPRQPCKWCFDLNGDFMACGGVEEVLIEPLFNSVELYIIGGGHCGRALSPMATQCGFAVTVIDDRAEVANPEQHPTANRVICAPYEQVADYINFSSDTYIVAMTHGHKHDIHVMERILGREYKYFGVIGSKNKVTTAFNNLRDKGYADEVLRTIYSPIGFAIGSQTPHEVAVSIMAQLIAVKNGVTAIAMNSNILI